MTTTNSKRRTTVVGASLAAAAVIGASVIGAATLGTGGTAADLQGQPTVTSSTAHTQVGNDKNYSLIQTITNNSATQTLTLTGSTVDNGGTITQSETTIAPKTSQVYVATNHGNGVQMKLTFTASNGAVVVVDGDVPKVNSDWLNGLITGPGLGFSSSSSAGSGNNANMSITVEDCTGNNCNLQIPIPGPPMG